MSHSPIMKSCIGATLAVAAALLVAAPAQATVYRGSWDPSYGSIFPNLGWKAEATFDAPTSCLGQPDGSYAVSGNCAGFMLLSAQVDFYNSTIDPNPLTSPVLESFMLNPAVFVNGVTIAGGQLAGVRWNRASDRLGEQRARHPRRVGDRARGGPQPRRCLGPPRSARPGALASSPPLLDGQ